MKLCINCKHCRKPTLDSPSYGCEKAIGPNPVFPASVNPVAGESYVYKAYYARIEESLCGMEAKWFEPKTT